METIKNKGYVEKLYVLLGASIFIHYALLVVVSLAILTEIFVSGEYKKILKNKSLMIVETVLGFSIIMSLFYRNYYGLIAVPILLCTEDDVEGLHAASAGEIDDNILFYIMSRGFSESEAKRLILESKFAETIDLIENEEIRKRVYTTLSKKLSEV